jgi:hypothetical protein
MTRYKYAEVPGTVTVQVIVPTSPDPRNKTTLGRIRRLLGGDNGSLTDPLKGLRHALSISQWNDLPDATPAILRYHFKADSPDFRPTRSAT